MSLKLSTKNLMLLALFAAISIILTRFLSFYLPILAVNTVRISLGNIPIALAGLLLGPIGGAITGIVADLIGATMFSGLGYFPGFTLSAALVGFIPGILKSRIGESITFGKVLVIILITEVITSIGLNTLWLTILTHVNYLVLVIPRAGITLGMSLVYSWIIYVLYKRLHRELH
ncbi:folate family ECF transporter S component [Sinanaerobacter chloroacetimidivorans]|jgi:ECF transporter S component (folate family)|uniref:Folate family ECF transporter S component n=1 Tax=Sinanaerobacter chloroacetimidivorans TaxID=2818044 RepID=A0A8J8B325_9FIRM|nr:folate family ECF transporter S component [Sinanaerobacter chloroacetimidivorans]MBR0600428.1 folate family ECF transporter S component [Sinanaerobacter chloroacetimidivorans]